MSGGAGKTYQENMSGWVRALRDAGLHLPLGTLQEDRLAEIENLKASGLPIYDYHLFPLEDFLENGDGMRHLFDHYGGQVVVRAAALGGRHQRLTRIGEDWATCCRCFREAIPVRLYGAYRVIVNEYDPARYCGVVISAPGSLVIEMVQELNLENLSHGRAIPWQAFFGPRFGAAYRAMSYGPNIRRRPAGAHVGCGAQPVQGKAIGRRTAGPGPTPRRLRVRVLAARRQASLHRLQGRVVEDRTLGSVINPPP